VVAHRGSERVDAARALVLQALAAGVGQREQRLARVGRMRRLGDQPELCIGVESTARTGYRLGYEVVVASDACADSSASMHANSLENVFPRLGRVDTTDAIIARVPARS
jgi:hypothetical protein